MTKTQDLLDEANSRVDLLANSLPDMVDPANISFSAKIPYKILAYREALIWRTEELARCAVTLYRQENHLSAIILSRCVTESAASAWYLMESVEQQVLNGLENNFDSEVAMRLLMGDKTNHDLPDPVHVLKTIRRADKTVPGVLSSYNALSEFAHPNWSGTSLLFTQIDREILRTRLGKYPRDIEGSNLARLEKSHRRIGHV